MKFVGFDIETVGASAEFSSGSAVWDAGRLYSQDPLELIDTLRKLGRQGYTLGAHNAEYEVTNLLWRQGEEVSIHYHQGHYKVAFWRTGRSRRMTQIWCSHKLSGGLPLDELGRAIGLPKYPTPQRLQGGDPDRYTWLCEAHGVGECQECYNLRDAEIVWQFLTQLEMWVSPHGVKLHPTLPKISFELWQQLDPNQQQQISAPAIRDLARQAYHGGRCEVFQFGRIDGVHTYDRKYYYAWLLSQSRLPDCRYLHLAEHTPWSVLEGEALGVVEATCWVPEMHLPPLPVQLANLLCFPVGTIKGVWTMSELREAAKRGVEVLELGRGAWSERWLRPFAQFADVLIKARWDYEQAQDPRQAIPKFLANAAAGRLGMDEAQERWIFKRWRAGMSAQNLKGWSLETDRTHVYLCKQQRIHGIARGSNVLWAAHLTAYGRLHLQEDLELAGQAAVYCDTDSVHSRFELTQGEELPGALRSTGFFEQGLYLGPKLYRLEGYDGARLVRAKGIPRRAADAYLLSGQASYQTVLGVIKGIAIGKEPGQWLDVERHRRTALLGRQLLNPKAIRELDQVSETLPLVCSLEALRDWSLRIEV